MITPTNAPDQSICPLGVSERALSALRDNDVSQAEAARLAAHVATCPACSARLAAFDALADILRSERPPEPDGRLWPTITTAAGAPVRLSRMRFARVRPASAAWSRAGALVAVLLLAIGFVALFSLHHPTPPVQHVPTATLAPTATFTPSATATLQHSPLTWRPVGVSNPLEAIAFADDGESAYKCSVSDDGQGNAILNIWRTSDRGAHWNAARTVPNDPTVNGCELVVDTSDPSVAALAWQPRGGGAGDSYTGLMTTVDGGLTWQAAPANPFVQIDQLDSRNGVIYALRETVDSSNSVAYHLWASSDRMRSWRQVDQGMPAAVAGFWLQPDGSGILMVVSGGANAIASQLWSSPNGGATWRQLSVPGGLPSYMPTRFASAGIYPNGIVARSLQGRFHICVSNATVGASAPYTPDVTCSADSGATWHARPLLLFTASQGPSVYAYLVSVTDDGTVLAAGFGSLYRLTASSSRWQSLGSLPESVVFYCPSPGAGMLWAAPGSIGDPVDPQNRIFTANYTP